MGLIRYSNPSLTARVKFLKEKNAVGNSPDAITALPPANDSLLEWTRLFFEHVKLSLCLTNAALRHEGVWRSGCIDSHFLDLGTS
jgi:hypothetical protein